MPSRTRHRGSKTVMEAGGSCALTLYVPQGMSVQEARRIVDETEELTRRNAVRAPSQTRLGSTQEALLGCMTPVNAQESRLPPCREYAASNPQPNHTPTITCHCLHKMEIAGTIHELHACPYHEGDSK